MSCRAVYLVHEQRMGNTIEEERALQVMGASMLNEEEDVEVLEVEVVEKADKALTKQ